MDEGLVAPGSAASRRTCRRLFRGLASLHRFHWFVVVLSLLVTFGAWGFSRGLVAERNAARFDRETEHLVELVTERMARYEDALQAGIATIATHDGDVDRETWRRFAEALDIDERYPGIAAVSLVRRVDAAGLAPLIEEARRLDERFAVHPVAGGDEHYVIMHIEPAAPDHPALGLDIAHEPRRYRTARSAMASGEPRMTAPLTLIRDEVDQTGFLFYAPWRVPGRDGRSDREGLVSASFVVRSLMDSMLEKKTRQVRVAISDAGETIHDEHDPRAADHDPEPLFTRTVEVPLHGRVWRFDVRSNLAFRALVDRHQPTMVLVGGIVIDLMLMGLFLGMSRANRAMRHVAAVNVELERKANALTETNRDLERFACVVSHDLKTPLRGIGDLLWYLEEDLEPVLAAPDAPPDAIRNIGRLHTQVNRMNGLIEGILDYSAAGTQAVRVESVDARAVIAEIATDLEVDDERLAVTGPLPVLETCRTRFEQVMYNVVGNAFKYHPEPATARVRVQARRIGNRYRFSIADDGGGIDPRYRERIFEMFQTLQSKDDIESTGIGLSIVRKSVESVGGAVHVDDTPGGGATFHVDWPLDTPAVLERAGSGHSPDTDIRHAA